jgi:tetratricopeptide (TPR) repeat protein
MWMKHQAPSNLRVAHMSAENSALRRAQELAACSKNDAALSAYREALAENWGDFRAAFGEGLMLQRLGRHEEAISSFTHVIWMRPDVAEAYYSRALSRNTLKNFDQALLDAEHALKLNPDYTDAMYVRGVSLKSLERHEEALEAFTTVLSRAGKYPPASHGRATIRYMNGDYHGAIADFSDCLVAGLDRHDIRLLRGLAYHRIGKFHESIEDLTVAIEMRPEDGSTYIRRWQAYKALGDDANAAKDMDIGKRLLRSQRKS